ncbi:hypothetical protein RM555_10595 [Micromonospora sp. DSM 115977]|uniref:Uncharacterized protein n=1 Tax=Micromonospora reichwaldensis TaxID=3075516 RepID=A0ABU2WU31_9ACTN|nr:hypothetical protein [Micromonospora sp. DSM 115977]MDT0529435.1 hypothetical protein [Micromonospora sp. DSM 115977]
MNTTPRTPARSREVWQRPFVQAHQKWCDDFVIELRLRDVPGPVIGEHLGEVEAHCAETGETPSEAFGDPTDYARRLHESGSPAPVSGVWKITVLSAAQVLAMLVGTAAVAPWARGERLSYNAVQLACLGVFLLVLLSLPKLLSPLMRHPLAVGLPLAALVPLVAVGAAAAGRLGLPAVLTLPAPALSLGLFVVVGVLAFVEHRELARDGDGDLVTSPFAPVPGAPRVGERRRRLAALVPSCSVPVAYLVLAAVSWVFA